MPHFCIHFPLGLWWVCGPSFYRLLQSPPPHSPLLQPVEPILSIFRLPRLLHIKWSIDISGLYIPIHTYCFYRFFFKAIQWPVLNLLVDFCYFSFDQLLVFHFRIAIVLISSGSFGGMKENLRSITYPYICWIWLDGSTFSAYSSWIRLIESEIHREFGLNFQIFMSTTRLRGWQEKQPKINESRKINPQSPVLKSRLGYSWSLLIGQFPTVLALNPTNWFRKFDNSIQMESETDSVKSNGNWSNPATLIPPLTEKRTKHQKQLTQRPPKRWKWKLTYS